jgi:plastocyanin
MKKLILPVAALALLAFVVTGCGKPIGGSTSTTGGSACTGGKIEMASVDFVQHTCTIKAGDQVTFVDPSGPGGYHILCLGHNQTCVANANGPAALNNASGIAMSAGDPNKSFTFATAGSYEVTCTVHSVMNVTITVQ